MRDTVWAIIFSQTPIALACLWVAWEVRGIRKATERITAAAEILLGREADERAARKEKGGAGSP
jgi:hypothetical protein